VSRREFPFAPPTVFFFLSRASVSSVSFIRSVFKLDFGAYGVLLHSFGRVAATSSNNSSSSNKQLTSTTVMAVAAAQKSREMFAINKSYSIEVRRQ